MNQIKFVGVFILAAMVALATVKTSVAADAAKDSKSKDKSTVTGTSSCGGCSGVADSCCVMLTDSNGTRWILSGENDSVKAAFKVRHDGKKMTASYTGKAETKKDKDGKEYKTVKVSSVKIDS